MASFKERLRHLRLLAEYSQQDLADKLKVSKQTISQYERGVREPDYDNLLALCDIFNVSTDYLLGISDKTVRFLNTEDLEAVEGNYYLDDETREYVDFLHKNPEHKVLFDASRKVSKEDINKALKAIGLFIDEE